MPRWPVPADAAGPGIDAAAFRPSSEQFGQTSGVVLRCTVCGHGSLAEAPDVEIMEGAYTDAADPVSRREEEGQVETARRALLEIERFTTTGLLVDLGCWTGSFLVAAGERGWDAIGFEPSRWASDEARARGLDVRTAPLEQHGLPDGCADAVVLGDVLEHLIDPGAALDLVGRLLAPSGALWVTVPDAGSRTARLLGRRWWSVLPMHVQYFTRPTMTALLDRHGFEARSVRSHAKVFTAQYYVERLGGYVPGLGRAAGGAVGRIPLGRRLVAPDFRDRMAIVATRAPAAVGAQRP